MTLAALAAVAIPDRGVLSALAFCFWVVIGCILSA
jgi:hypothetical protein